LKKVVSVLIPNHEDVFSILRALDRLSQSVNVEITDYAIDTKERNNNETSIVVNVIGDTNAFIDL